MGNEPPLQLVGVEVENLRGFEHAALRLDRDVLVLVGPNNAGKTSILRMLDWVFNAPIEQFENDFPMSEDVVDLLRPARDTRNKARRLTLLVRVVDGRRHARFRCERGVARLRIGLRLSPQPSLRLNLGRPRRGESSERYADGSLVRDYDADALFEELRDHTRFTLVPASRDAASSSFNDTLGLALTSRLQERAVHSRRGGTRSEYRQMSNALEAVTGVAEGLAEPLWDEMRKSLPAGLAKRGVIKVDATPADLVEWVASQLRFTLSTGDHDVNSVRPTEVGSGLQSLLELALIQAEEQQSDGVATITALEEPEAFLHPAAQRTLARDLFRSTPGMRLISTHSPILVEEARFGDVVLVHDRQFHHARSQDDPAQADINTALLTRYGAEMVFAQSVLLVEGEADRVFFETLRRRLAPFDHTGLIDGMFVIPTGSNSFFAPWIRLIRSYGDDGEGPMKWLALVDSDCPAAIRKGFGDAGARLGPKMRAALDDLASTNGGDDLDDRTRAARRVNRVSQQVRSPLLLSPGDLEWASLNAATDATARRIGELMDIDVDTADELIRDLGSKHVHDPRGGLKHPWRRGLLARELPWDEISPDSVTVLRRWLQTVMPPREINALMRAAAEGESAA